jgi:hypothetical protein
MAISPNVAVLYQLVPIFPAQRCALWFLADFYTYTKKVSHVTASSSAASGKAVWEEWLDPKSSFAYLKVTVSSKLTKTKITATLLITGTSLQHGS